jgi:hypothetical protein
VPADKDAAKRRRQARNRQERQNRQARTEGAKRAATRPSRAAEETPTRAAKGTGKTDLSKTPARPAAAPGGILGKLFPPRPEPVQGTDGRPARTARPPRPPSEVVEVGDVPGPRGILLRLTSQPGGRAAVLALLVALVSGLTLFVAPVAPPPVLDELGAMVVVQADGGDALDTAALDDVQEEDFADDPVVAEYSVGLLDLVPPAAAAVYALVPVLIAGMAVRALTRGTRTRTLMICAVTGVLYVVMLGPIGVFFFLGVLALGFAAYQSAKADKLALAASA